MDFPVALISDWNGIAGREIAHALAACEFHLIINGPEDEIFELQSHDYPGKIIAFPFDYSDEDSVERTLMSILEIFEHIDVLVNNVHKWVDAKFLDLTDEQFMEAYNHNLLASFHICRAAARLMDALGYGKIINLTSTSCFTGAHTPLAASCAALHSLTKSIAKEMAPLIRCNTVACGLIEEDWVVEAGEELIKSLSSGVPLKRLCQPHDVAELVAFLCTGGDFMTGQMLVLDGGETMRF